MKPEPLKVLRRPIVTEKSGAMKETRNQVVFEVDREATKAMVRDAIEIAFKVKVVAVNTLIVPGKTKRVGKYEGKRSSWKKAVATLRVGDKIEVVEGV